MCPVDAAPLTTCSKLFAASAETVADADKTWSKCAYGMLEGTFAKSGTLNAPFVTTHAVVVPALVAHVPEPEKVPVALVLDSAEIAIEPVVSVQRLPNVWPDAFWPMMRFTSLQVLVLVLTQFTSMLNVPVACPLTLMTVRSDVVPVFGTLAAMFVLLSVASLNPIAQEVAYGVLASAVDVIAPVAL